MRLCTRIGIIDQSDAMGTQDGTRRAHESRRIRIVLDRRHKAVRAIWKNMSRHQRRQLNRAAIHANDQSEPSSRDPVISQSAPRSQRGRGRVRESAAAVASRGFRLLKIPSGGISPFQTATTLQALCRKDYPHFFRALHGLRVAVAKPPGSACATSPPRIDDDAKRKPRHGSRNEGRIPITNCCRSASS